MRVIVLGPNGINDVTFHVHRKGCRDVYAPRNREALLDRSNWDFDASSEQQVIEELFSDFIPTNDDGEPTSWLDYRNDARIFPCVKFENR